MNANSITGDVINVRLRQLGASSIREINSIMHIVRFELESGFEVAYVSESSVGLRTAQILIRLSRRRT